MNDFILSPNEFAIYNKTTGVLIEDESLKPGPGNTITMSKSRTEENSAFFLPWGEGNRRPIEIQGIVGNDPSMPEIIRWKVATCVGRGVRPVNSLGYDGDKEIFEAITDPEIVSFYGSRKFYRWYVETTNDYYTHQNGGGEMILSKDRSKIVDLCHQEISYTRYGVRNSKGIIDHALINANWPQVVENDRYTTKVPMVNLYGYDNVGEIKAGKDFKYYYPVNWPGTGDEVYQTATWYGFVKSQWIDVRREIPIFKKALLKNRMLILYHVKVPGNYWETVNPKFKQLSATKQAEIRKAEYKRFNDFMTDVENAGKAFFSEYAVGLGMKEFVGWQIESIKNGAVGGENLEDFHETTSNLFFAHGVDPTLMGFSSKEMGARSGGSDKREAWLLYQEKIQPDRALILEAADFIAEYNGWKAKYPGLKLYHIDKVLTTLDTGAGTKKVVG